jgi:predicted membrane channel-forming protein YqfA (hemolysin III family)
MALASSGILPMIHVAVREGPEVLARFPLSNLSTTCGCYALGTVFYVLRVPEKQIPKIFDVWVGFSLLFFPHLTCSDHDGENWALSETTDHACAFI